MGEQRRNGSRSCESAGLEGSVALGAGQPDDNVAADAGCGGGAVLEASGSG